MLMSGWLQRARSRFIEGDLIDNDGNLRRDGDTDTLIFQPGGDVVLDERGENPGGDLLGWS